MRNDCNLDTFAAKAALKFHANKEQVLTEAASQRVPVDK